MIIFSKNIILTVLGLIWIITPFVMWYISKPKKQIKTVEELHNKEAKEKYELPKKYRAAKFASLEYKVLYYNTETNLSLVEVNLNTGRHHQIRLQFSNINHSIYGDQKYGTRGIGKQINLWAYELEIEHPISKEKMKFRVLPKKEGSWKILEQVNL